MQTGKTTPPAAAALALAGNKPASPSKLSLKQPPVGAAGAVELAVDGKRTMAARAAVAGGGAFSDGDLEPKEISADVVKKVAAEMSSMLRSLIAPKDSNFADQASFSKEVEALQKTCDAMVDGTSFDDDVATTMLLGVQARITLLLATDQNPQDLLLSSMGQIKASVEEHTKAKPMASDDATGRVRLYDYDMVKKYEKSSIIQLTPTVCSNDEVKAVLDKTLALLESSEPANSTTDMARLFYKLRSNCRALAEDVQKHGVHDKTGSAIKLFHISALFVLGQHKKYFNYQDAADDSLLSSLRRLEVAVRDYTLGGPAEDTTD